MIEIVPNLLQGGFSDIPVFIDGKAPDVVTRLGAKKVNYLLKGFGSIPKNAKILEIFGGSNLSTVLIAKHLNRSFVSADIHYSFYDGWRYDVFRNYKLLAEEYGVKSTPFFIGCDATFLPFRDKSFDIVIAPDPPRTRFNDAGKEVKLDIVQQRKLFHRTVESVKRVADRMVTTIPTSYGVDLRKMGFDVKMSVGHDNFKFKQCSDSVVYCSVRF